MFDAFSSVITDRIRNIVRQYQHHLNDVRGSLAELDEQVREVRKQPPPFDQLTDITLDQLLKYKDTVK